MEVEIIGFYIKIIFSCYYHMQKTIIGLTDQLTLFSISCLPCSACSAFRMPNAVLLSYSVWYAAIVIWISSLTRSSSSPRSAQLIVISRINSSLKKRYKLLSNYLAFIWECCRCTGSSSSWFLPILCTTRATLVYGRQS